MFDGGGKLFAFVGGACATVATTALPLMLLLVLVGAEVAVAARKWLLLVLDFAGR